MNIKIKNIGKVKEADIEIRRITVIAGPNDTGKSTVSRALFSVFNSFYHIHEKMKHERESRLLRIFNVIFIESSIGMLTSKLLELVDNVLKQKYEEKRLNIDYIAAAFEETITYFSENDKNKLRNNFKKYSNLILDALNITDEEFFVASMNRNLNSVFNNQINNIFTSKEGVITLYIKNRPMEIKIIKDKVVGVGSRVSLNTEAVYLDNPFVLNELGNPLVETEFFPLQEKHILRKLERYKAEDGLFSEIIVSKKLESVYANINEVFEGQITSNGRDGWVKKLPKASKPLDVRNLSAGLKTFAIIKTLLINRTIEENGTLILDEPEVHLHPEWQLIFARLIIELQKVFGLHILLNTHSPYFLHAIEVYAELAGIADECKYYRAYNKGDFSFIKDVTNNLEEIYETLAGPLQILENERYAD